MRWHKSTLPNERNSKMKNPDKYEVGYGKPPKQTQFQKGQSGNPKGRPKRSQNMSTLLADELGRKIQVTENGQTKTMTAREAMVRRIVNGALSGKAIDVLKLMKMLESLLPSEVEPEQVELPEYSISFVKGVDGRPFNPTDEEYEHLAERRKAKAKKQAEKASAQIEEDNDDFLN
ncbi:MAG: DUF5681 domain-containing protein [Pseudomonadota bacterium]